jgi:hypothetical protein
MCLQQTAIMFPWVASVNCARTCSWVASIAPADLHLG